MFKGTFYWQCNHESHWFWYMFNTLLLIWLTYFFPANSLLPFHLFGIWYVQVDSKISELWEIGFFNWHDEASGQVWPSFVLTKQATHPYFDHVAGLYGTVKSSRTEVIWFLRSSIVVHPCPMGEMTGSSEWPGRWNTDWSRSLTYIH